ncbi:trimeric intracellular cation channel family protein [Alteromonas gracilis]|uniref:trimeric intracellular cation channel family protein n=1 Tax=Alteromonas gracilis TaxID=1479524 RepID=UPI00373537B7
MSSDYFIVLGIIGVAFFAVSGALLGHDKNINGFGIVVVGVMTALGGGTLRDLLLGKPIFWVETSEYLLATYLAIFATVLFVRYLPSPSNFYFIFIDTVGLAIFNVMGIEKALISGASMIVALTMGMTTGIFGGLMRDVVCREVPYVMRGDVYASACFAGGLTYAALFAFDIPYIWCILGSISVTVLLRVASLHWGVKIDLFRKRTPKADKMHKNET